MKKPAAASRTDVEMVTHYMPMVVRSDTVTERERKFVASIITQSRRAGWWPSAGQFNWMRQIAEKFKAQKMTQDDSDGDLIE